MSEYHFDAVAVRDRMVEEIKKLATQQGFCADRCSPPCSLKSTCWKS